MRSSRVKLAALFTFPVGPTLKTCCVQLILFNEGLPVEVQVGKMLIESDRLGLIAFSYLFSTLLIN